MPGFRWRTSLNHSPNDNRLDCGAHVFSDLHLRFEFSTGGWVTGHYSYTASEVPTLNGQLTTPETATEVLRNLMSPNNNGIGP